ncbi:MAG: GNAT family N-acetyltransferase [Phycisphaerae bacterium]|nr:GNAT family N-acetyltransferase [Gemmatimonadaceae bacterium]
MTQLSGVIDSAATFPDAVAVRHATADDASAILTLHQTVANISGGLARFADEITEEYVQNFVTSSLANGVIVVAERESTRAIVGELHAYPYSMRRLGHTLTSLTIAVHPDAQGMGVGGKLFRALLHEVRVNRPNIMRVELIVQENNSRARRLYESVGFVAEGRMLNAIRDIRTGQLETDVPMAWLRERDVSGSAVA